MSLPFTTTPTGHGTQEKHIRPECGSHLAQAEPPRAEVEDQKGREEDLVERGGGEGGDDDDGEGRGAGGGGGGGGG
jgi:hypothetical protein